MNLPQKSGFGGKLGRELNAILAELRSLRPITGPGSLFGRNSMGTYRTGLGAGGGSGAEPPESLFVRHIGIDAMWVSRPLAPGYSFANYWNMADSDLSEHFFCLKPFQLQNRYWWDEGADEGRLNDWFGIAAGASPQTGLTTVQSVAGEAYDLGTGSFDGLQQRVLRYSDTTPEDVNTQFISPPWLTVGWGVGQVSYAGTTGIAALRIPKGLIVCDEKGAIVWDAFDSFSVGDKPDTLTNVETWAIDDPGGVGGDVSVPKEGLYDVEFIDLNFDGRHWKQKELNDEQSVMALTALKSASLDPSETYTLKVVAGTPQWVEDP